MRNVGRAAVTALTISLTLVAHAREAKKPLVPGTHVEEQLQHHGHYSNAKGEDVHAPAKHIMDGAIPDGATATCRDGAHSFSHSRSGTCSGHGGVAKWLR